MDTHINPRMNYLVNNLFTATVPLRNFKMSTRNVFTILSAKDEERAIIPDGVDVRDVDFPDSHIKLLAEAKLGSVKFRPENLWDVKRISYSNGEVKLEVGQTNYGSVAVQREIYKEYVFNSDQEKNMLAVQNQLSGLGAIGIFYNKKKGTVFVGRRGDILVSGKVMPCLGATVGTDTDLLGKLTSRAKQVMDFDVVDGANRIYTVGASRDSYQSGNVSVNVVIESDMSEYSMKKGMKAAAERRNGSPEYKAVKALKVGEIGSFVKKEIYRRNPRSKEFYSGMVGNGLMALLQFQRGVDYNGYQSLIGDLTGRYCVRIVDSNPFA